jgi:hypothetical protein
MLNYFQHRAGGRGDDESKFGAALNFIDDHGQSLDWLIRGDPAGMICAAAARSTAAVPQFDPIFAAIEAVKEADAAFTAACDRYEAIEQAPDDVTDEEAEEGLAAQNAACGAVHAAAHAFLETIPTTRQGLLAGVGFVISNLENHDFLFDQVDELFDLLVSIDRAVRRGLDRGERALPAPATDPIFEAINVHRRKYREFEARCSELDDARTPEAETEYARLDNADDGAARALTRMRPTTVAGAAALARYVAKLDRGGCTYEFGKNHQTWPGRVLANISAALSEMAAGGEAVAS